VAVGAFSGDSEVDEERVEGPSPEIVVAPMADLVEEAGIEVGADHGRGAQRVEALVVLGSGVCELDGRVSRCARLFDGVRSELEEDFGWEDVVLRMQRGEFGPQVAQVRGSNAAANRNRRSRCQRSAVTRSWPTSASVSSSTAAVWDRLGSTLRSASWTSTASLAVLAYPETR
jgi:hypothetical protein